MDERPKCEGQGISIIKVAIGDYLCELELRKNFLDKTSRIQSIVRMKYEKRTDEF